MPQQSMIKSCKKKPKAYLTVNIILSIAHDFQQIDFVLSNAAIEVHSHIFNTRVVEAERWQCCYCRYLGRPLLRAPAGFQLSPFAGSHVGNIIHVHVRRGFS